MDLSSYKKSEAKKTMKVLPLIILTSFFFTTASCQNNEIDEELSFDHHTKQILFFSDESKYQLEASYYDALIELKQHYPEEIKNMMTLSPENAEKYYEWFDVKECPALIVVYNDQIVVRVNGENSKHEIIEPISTALSSAE